MDSTILKQIISRFLKEFALRRVLPFIGGLVLLATLVWIMNISIQFSCWVDRFVGYERVKERPGYYAWRVYAPDEPQCE